MSENKEIIKNLIKFIESAVKKGFEKENFVKKFRQKIDDFIAEKST